MQVEKVRENFAPKFRGYSRSVYNFNAAGDLMYKNETWAVRSGIRYWKRLIKFISEKYKDIPKVNVYDYACSVGHEAYTFIMAMFSSDIEKNPEKFMPVIAKDFDSKVIAAAKRREFALDIIEKDDLQGLIGKKRPLDEFLFVDERYEQEHGCFTVLADRLTDNVKFHKADILSDIKNIEPDNSIVFARNCWAYSKSGEREKLAGFSKCKKVKYVFEKLA